MTAADRPGERPLPEVDAVTQGWWDATRARRLVLQHCTGCGAYQHYPRPICLACRAADPEFVAVSGRGTVHSFTVVTRAPSEAFHPPYVVALIDLDEGPRLMSSVVGCDPRDVRCDLPVQVAWEPLADGRHLPVFVPDAPERT